ncbi:MAG: hypothetical protein GY765_29065 [bacterium]|nr:hypothetical protein [bacterium]
MNLQAVETVYICQHKSIIPAGIPVEQMILRKVAGVKSISYGAGVFHSYILNKKSK